MMLDLRSDTLTLPTQAMREAMYRAEVGDDVWDEDPTVQRLEALAADLVGKEAALFVPSGTMGNQLAAMTHMPERGMECIVEADSHIFFYEVGGLAVLSGAHVRALPGVNGMMSPEQLKAAIRPENIHMPKTGLVCLENTHNRAGGTVMTPGLTDALCAVAHERGVPVHIDGARIFNASVALGEPVSRLVANVDSVMFCLSKGLCAPVGSILAGRGDFIARARRNRKMLGGGMRQVGILAAAGILALTEMVDRLAEDHDFAKRIAAGIEGTPGIKVNPVDTNIVLFDVSGTGTDAVGFVNGLKGRGVLASDFGPTSVRLVTHRDVSGTDAQTVIDSIKGLAKSLPESA